MIRIITGTLRGRRIETPKGLKTRPLPDRVRASMFNMLNEHCEGYAFADVFAGSGSFGLEALSRGATECLFVERDRHVGTVLKRNIENLGLNDRAIVMHADALGLAVLGRCPKPVHVINFDPPYPMMNDPAQRALVLEQFVRMTGHLDSDGFALIRTPHPFREPRAAHEDTPAAAPPTEVDMTLPGLEGPETHVYGSTAVHWYMRGGQAGGGGG